MNRRGFLGVIAGGLLAVPLAAKAQQVGKKLRIGVLTLLPRSSMPGSSGWLAELRDLGYVEGQNLVVEWRFGGDRAGHLDDFAAELVGLKVDVIVAATGLPTVRAAMRATREIPVVAIDWENDPVAVGYIASYARPGGNVTGVFLDLPELRGKQLELLKETFPGVQRVGILLDATGDPAGTQLESADAAAHALGMHPHRLPVRSVSDLEPVFGLATRQHIDALLVLSSPLLLRERARIAGLAIKNHLPLISLFCATTEAGGLMSYGLNRVEASRAAGRMVDRIAKGAKPQDLPAERPARFYLVIT